MVSIPVIPYHVAAAAEVDIVAVTAVNPSVGGVSGRLTVRNPRRQFTCTVGPDYTPVVRKIHYTHRARWPVAIRDWGDYIFEDEPLTAVGGEAPLTRLIQSAANTRYLTQRVLIPDENEEDIVIKVDGSPLDRSAWDFDNFGIVTGLPDGVVTWSGRALVPVCFMDDILAVQINAKQTAADEYGVQSIPQVRFEEIFETELIALMGQADDSV